MRLHMAIMKGSRKRSSPSSQTLSPPRTDRHWRKSSFVRSNSPCVGEHHRSTPTNAGTVDFSRMSLHQPLARAPLSPLHAYTHGDKRPAGGTYNTNMMKAQVRRLPTREQVLQARQQALPPLERTYAVYEEGSLGEAHLRATSRRTRMMKWRYLEWIARAMERAKAGSVGVRISCCTLQPERAESTIYARRRIVSFSKSVSASEPRLVRFRIVCRARQSVKLPS